jgi:hypothetical protein
VSTAEAITLLAQKNAQKNQPKQSQPGTQDWAAKLKNGQKNQPPSFITTTNARIQSQLDKLEDLHKSVNYLLEALTKFFPNVQLHGK